MCYLSAILVIIFPSCSLCFLEPQTSLLIPSYVHKTLSTFAGEFKTRVREDHSSNYELGCAINWKECCALLFWCSNHIPVPPVTAPETTMLRGNSVSPVWQSIADREFRWNFSSRWPHCVWCKTIVQKNCVLDYNLSLSSGLMRNDELFFNSFDGIWRCLSAVLHR